MKKFIILLILLLIANPVFAKESLELSISFFQDTRSSMGNVLRMREGEMRPFYVHVRNVSQRSQQLYEREGNNPSSITFEAEDEFHNRNVISKITPVPQSNMDIYREIPSGSVRVFKIILDEYEWENAFKLYKEGARKIKVRAIFSNRGNKIYSEYYTIIIH